MKAGMKRNNIKLNSQNIIIFSSGSNIVKY